MITSRQNDRVKEIRSLKQKKYRDELGLYIVEGFKSVVEVLKSTHEVALIVGVLEQIEKVKSVADIDGISVLEVSQSVYESVSDEVTPQGVLAVVKTPTYQTKYSRSISIALDGVADPGNVGAIIRTAAASGYEDVYLISSADPYSPKAVRSSMSGIFKVRTHFVSREDFCKNVATPVVIATMEGENVFSFTAPKDFCLVIGNEANGVSKEVRAVATHLVSIPMQNGVESLNASVSAGILMYGLKSNRY